MQKGESVSDNYTPISFLLVLSKILEKNIEMHVRKHVETNNIFYVKKHGFRNKYSTDTALGELVGNLVEIFDKKHKAITVLMT